MELTNRAVRSDILAVERHPQAVLLLYLDPARSRGSDDEHGRVSRLVMKCHQREQAEGKDELCNDFFYLASAAFLCVCWRRAHELHPVLIKAALLFFDIITECGARLQRILLLSPLFAAPQNRLQAHSPPRLFLPIAILLSVIYCTPSFSSPVLHLPPRALP